jgi:hypothetical protein
VRLEAVSIMNVILMSSNAQTEMEKWVFGFIFCQKEISILYIFWK